MLARMNACVKYNTLFLYLFQCTQYTRAHIRMWLDLTLLSVLISVERLFDSLAEPADLQPWIVVTQQLATGVLQQLRGQ